MINGENPQVPMQPAVIAGEDPPIRLNIKDDRYVYDQ